MMTIEFISVKRLNKEYSVHKKEKEIGCFIKNNFEYNVEVKKF
jgi:hypothetical protein